MDSAQVAQAQVPQVDVAAFTMPPEISLWSVILDPAFLVLILSFAVVFGLSFFHPSGRRYVKKQTDYLDHQQAVNEKALRQNEAMEELIAKQYAETNARSDMALAQAQESLRLHAEALEQLKGMNSAMVRLTVLIEQERGGTA